MTIELNDVYVDSFGWVIVLDTNFDFTDVTECKSILKKPDGSTVVRAVAGSDYGVGTDSDEAYIRIVDGDVDQPGRYEAQISTRNSGGAVPLFSQVVTFRALAPLADFATVWP